MASRTLRMGVVGTGQAIEPEVAIAAAASSETARWTPADAGARPSCA